jgi:hypothetical protein
MRCAKSPVAISMPYNQRGRTWVREKPASIMA